MKLRTLFVAAALIVVGSLPAAFAQDTTRPKATGADVGKYPKVKGEKADEAMEKCGQEAAGVARETCLKRFRAEHGPGSGSTGSGSSTGSGAGMSDSNNDGRRDGTRNSPPDTPKTN